MKRHGWFKVDGVQDGDRTLAQQVKGLTRAFAAVQGKHVVDLGCAEGLIARAMMDAGAARVTGYEVVADHLKVAASLCANFSGVVFHHADLNDCTRLAPVRPVDVVLALAIIHKVREPENLLRWIAGLQPELVVIRLPNRTPGYVRDARSGNRFIPVDAHLTGYRLRETDVGHFDEWVGYYTAGAA